MNWISRNVIYGILACQIALSGNQVLAGQSDSIEPVTSTSPDVMHKQYSVIAVPDQMNEGAYLAPETSIFYQYARNLIETSAELGDTDKEDLLAFLKLSIFISQMDERHQQISKEAEMLMKHDPNTADKLTRLVLVEKSAISQHSVQLANMLQEHGTDNISERIIELQKMLVDVFSQIDSEALSEYSTSITSK